MKSLSRVWLAFLALSGVALLGCSPCGNGKVQEKKGEQCDDGNVQDGDGCTAVCVLEVCGDGVDNNADNETCDDGNTAAGDGCDAACSVEDGFVCAGTPSVCATVCGDGNIAGAEACDDGNTAAGDGCDAACAVEAGFSCTGEPSVCVAPPTNCGDGVINPGEQCDDGNTVSGDGCEQDCTITAPATCGDGSLQAPEQCDDGNTTAGDGCAPNCLLEAGAACGDGNIDAGEECDDGNILPGDGCSFNCVFELTVIDSDPRVVSRETGATITLFGTGFEAPMSVTLEDCLTAATPPVALTTNLVDVNELSAELLLAADPTLVQSLYRFVVVNGDGQTAQSECILVISAQPPPSVTDVSPPFAFAGVSGDGVLSDATVQVTGTGFSPTPAVTFVSAVDASISFQSQLVNFISSTELSVSIPSESQAMPLGNYFVFVTNPNGLQGQFLLNADPNTPGTIEVRNVPPPTIANIDPPRDPGTADVNLTITGDGFQAGAIVSLILDDTGAEIALPTATTVVVSSSEIDVVLPSGTVADGIYPVKVTNPDGQFDIFFVYEQTNSSAGHLNQDAFVDAGVGLVIGRERHGAVEGFDIFGQSHIYVAGGMDAQKTILGSVERSQISIFGNPAPFEIVQQYVDGSTDDATARSANVLTTARAGLSLVRAGAFLYAVGGTTENPLSANDTGALNTIERARILGFETQPAISEPVSLGGNGLADGVWFYRVSAVSAEGESLASREVFTRGGGTIRVCFKGQNGESRFNIYRSLAADGRFGTTRLLVHEFSPTPGANGLLCFDDDGSNDVAQNIFRTPAPGRLSATLRGGGTLANGSFGYRVAAIRDGVETVAGYDVSISVDPINDPGKNTIELSWDVIPGATYNLYRVINPNDPISGVKLLAAGLTANNFLDNGAVTFADQTKGPREGVQVLPAGSLSKWSVLPITLAQPREGADAIVVTVFDGDPTTNDDPTFLYVTGGKPSHRAAAYHRSTEIGGIDVSTGDVVNPSDNTSPTLFEDTTHLLNFGRAYFPLLTNQGQFVTPFPPPPVEPPCGDVDGDGHNDIVCGGDDCDDTNPAVHPGQPEAGLCSNLIDDDCDGLPDCADDECVADPLCSCQPGPDLDNDGSIGAPCGPDCNDANPTVCIPDANDPSVCAAETLCANLDAGGNPVDDDCDGLANCFDPDCAQSVACSCIGAVDGDGDGHLAAPCGDDCNDADPTICNNVDPVTGDPIDANGDGIKDCLEVNCDGIDQDCNGFDLCIQSFPIEGAGAFSPRMIHAAVPRILNEPTAPILLVACAGDKNFVNNNNTGSADFEVTAIDKVTGLPTGWVVQTQPNLGGQGTFGHDALLYFTFVFSFPGVQAETVGQEPNAQGGTVARFPVDESAANIALVMDRFQSASASLSIARTYYSLIRLNAKIFALGGNNQNGATNTVDVHQQ